MKKSELNNLKFQWTLEAPKHVTNHFCGILMSAEESENKWNQFLQMIIEDLLTEEFDDIERMCL